MENHLDTDDLGQHYPALLDWLKTGQITGSRGGRTREVIDFALTLRDPHRCIVNRVGFSRRFMDAEIAMLLAGVYDGELLKALTPKAAELTTPSTAYGPRVRRQLPLILDELKTNPESRRAVVYVGRHDDLDSISEETAGEMPCTMTWQFLLRNGELHMIVNMRSWDAVWGLSYDVPCFVAVQMALAKDIGAPVGVYRHHAGSFHVYERHWELEADITDERLDLDWLCDDWQETVTAATAFVDIFRGGAIREQMERLKANA